MKWAALFPAVLIGYGIVTSVPWLFNLLGLALFVALIREGGKHVIPWPKVRRAMLLDKIENPSPERGSERGPEEEPQVGTLRLTRVGDACTIVSNPKERRSYRVESSGTPDA